MVIMSLKLYHHDHDKCTQWIQYQWNKKKITGVHLVNIDEAFCLFMR